MFIIIFFRTRCAHFNSTGNCTQGNNSSYKRKIYIKKMRKGKARENTLQTNLFSVFLSFLHFFGMPCVFLCMLLVCYAYLLFEFPFVSSCLIHFLLISFFLCCVSQHSVNLSTRFTKIQNSLNMPQFHIYIKMNGGKKWFLHEHSCRIKKVLFYYRNQRKKCAESEKNAK